MTWGKVHTAEHTLHLNKAPFVPAHGYDIIIFLPIVPFVIVDFFYSYERRVFSFFLASKYAASSTWNTLTLQTSHHTPLLKHTPPYSFCLVNSYSRSLTHGDFQQRSFCRGLGLWVRLVPPNLCCQSILCSCEKSWHILLIIIGLKSLFLKPICTLRAQTTSNLDHH